MDIKDMVDMEPHKFQQWVCDKMLAENTSPSPDKPSGVDGGKDGIVRTTDLRVPKPYRGAYIEVKRSEGVGDDVIKKFYTTLVMDKVSKGFIIGFSFTSPAVKSANELKRNHGKDIELVKAGDLCNIQNYFDRTGTFEPWNKYILENYKKTNFYITPIKFTPISKQGYFNAIVHQRIRSKTVHEWYCITHCLTLEDAIGCAENKILDLIRHDISKSSAFGSRNIKNITLSALELLNISINQTESWVYKDKTEYLEHRTKAGLLSIFH